MERGCAGLANGYSGILLEISPLEMEMGSHPLFAIDNRYRVYFIHISYSPKSGHTSRKSRGVTATLEKAR